MSEQFPHLSHAPITEALLDLRVVLPAGRTLAEIAAAFSVAVAADYPEQRPIQQLQAHLAFGEGVGGALTSAQHIGSIFWTPDRKRAVQARLDGFSVNQVGSYKNWETMIEEAQRRWKAYVAAAKPEKVVRCAARFINRIEVPVGDDLKKHLLTFPEVGNGLPPLLDEYSFRCLLPFDDGRRAAITQATVPSEGGSNSSTRALLLDIDAFSDREFAPESAELWAEFDQLRKIKNACFFDSLQPTTWKAYL
jgi:uncharacterized protein (TIGR04255 family)